MMSKQKIAGWLLSGLLGVFLIVLSASGKFTQWEGKAEMFAKLGWSESVMVTIGIVEVAITVLFLIPRTSFIGAILVTGYLGGAIATHVRIGDPYYMPLIMGVIVWVALGLRDARVFGLAFSGKDRFDSSVSLK